MSIDFRKAIPSDLQAVWKIFTDAILHMDEQGIVQWDEIYPDKDRILDDIKRQQMYLVIENGVLISTVVLNEYQDEEYAAVPWHYTKGKTAVIHRLCVSSSQQGKGWGKRTVQLSEQKLIKLGYICVRLDAFSQNPFALHLYESLGYEKVGEVRYRKGKFYCYEKRLSHLV
jgi:ribosomal protein S18 acetylase RimI-like enzyme